mmetsp:Transcript_109521/g.353463  ORF Transcript_109521/g.353463 Transcript_109521/m.353463 type:complete len:388 (+) Transcript_109521:375-1538(+)
METTHSVDSAPALERSESSTKGGGSAAMQRRLTISEGQVPCDGTARQATPASNAMAARASPWPLRTCSSPALAAAPRSRTQSARRHSAAAPRPPTSAGPQAAPAAGKPHRPAAPGGPRAAPCGCCQVTLKAPASTNCSSSPFSAPVQLASRLRRRHTKVRTTCAGIPDATCPQLEAGEGSGCPCVSSATATPIAPSLHVPCNGTGPTRTQPGGHLATATEQSESDGVCTRSNTTTGAEQVASPGTGAGLLSVSQPGAPSFFLALDRTSQRQEPSGANAADARGDGGRHTRVLLARCQLKGSLSQTSTQPVSSTAAIDMHSLPLGLASLADSATASTSCRAPARRRNRGTRSQGLLCASRSGCWRGGTPGAREAHKPWTLCDLSFATS